MSAKRAPAPTRTWRRTGSTSTDRKRPMSKSTPSSTLPLPATLWPPPLIARGSRPLSGDGDRRSATSGGCLDDRGGSVDHAIPHIAGFVIPGPSSRMSRPNARRRRRGGDRHVATRLGRSPQAIDRFVRLSSSETSVRASVACWKRRNRPKRGKSETSRRPRVVLLASPESSASVLYGLYNVLLSVGACTRT